MSAPTQMNMSDRPPNLKGKVLMIRFIVWFRAAARTRCRVSLYLERETVYCEIVWYQAGNVIEKLLRSRSGCPEVEGRK